MILRSVFISGMAFGLLVQGPSPVGADSGGNVSVRIVVTGRLLGHTATMRVHDSAGVSTIRVTGSRSIRVHSGRVTIVPSPIVGATSSTARIQQISVESGDVVRVHYRKDETSRRGALTPLVLGVDGEPASGRDLVPSPDRALLAFISQDRDLLDPDESAALFVRDLSTGVVTKMARDATGGIAWSPDSRRIAFRSGASDKTIQVTDLATGDRTVASNRSEAAAWVDVDHVAMSVCRTRRVCGIVIKSLSTGQVRRLVPVATRVQAWTLAPAGNSVLFESSVDPLNKGIERRFLYQVDVASGATRPIGADLGRGTSWGAVWSPDSGKVAFRTGAGRKARVLVKDLSAGSVMRLAIAADPDPRQSSVKWAPNSRMLAYRSPDGGLALLRLATERTHRLLAHSHLPKFPVVTGYTFSPSGKRIAFVFGGRGGCLTDVVPFADLNCRNVLVRELGSGRLANVSTRDTGLGWRGSPEEGTAPPVWLSDDEVVIHAPAHGSSSRATYPMIKTVEWAPTTPPSPAPQVPPWCDPYRYWWSC